MPGPYFEDEYRTSIHLQNTQLYGFGVAANTVVGPQITPGYRILSKVFHFDPP